MKLAKILGLIVAAVAVVSSLFALDGRFAKSKDVVQLSKRLELKIVQDRADYVQQRLWQIEDRYKDAPMPPTVLEEYRCLKCELKRLQGKVTGG